MSAHVLVVEPDSRHRKHLATTLGRTPMVVTEACSASETLSAVGADEFDLILLALRLPDRDGLQVLPSLATAHSATPVIIMTAYHSVGSAVEAMKKGAFDYLPKPFSNDQLMVTVRKALEARALRRQIARMTHENLLRYGVDAIIGHSPTIRSLRDQVLRIAESPFTTILIQGESGVGKDLAAKAIHYSSRVASQPFVPINCSAIPDSLLESELFGHERGAFTDATGLKRGMLELADGGTLFLDEVAEMSVHIQAKLLRFLEDRTLRRIGGNKDIALDVRIIAATNVDLEGALADGRLREDLYYRLGVVPLSVSPLRERVEDIPLLVRHFVDYFNKKLRKHFEGATESAMTRFMAHPWPGNVRELKNAVERVMILEEGPMIEARMLYLGERRSSSRLKTRVVEGVVRAAPAALSPQERHDILVEDLNLEHIELQALARALECSNGNQSRAAKLLGISRDKVRYRMRKYGVHLEARVAISPSIKESASHDVPI